MMRGLMFMAMMVGATSVAVPAMAQDAGDVQGRWRTSAQNGVVAIERCGANLCGRLIDAAALRANPDQRDVRNRNAALRNRPLQGVLVLQAFSGGPQEWRGGPLYDPETGQGAPTGTLKLVNADRLVVRGCIAPLLCRTQTWTRLR
nr:DUF2147 domain-containing protein [uncultured Brevundimonas sp.]